MNCAVNIDTREIYVNPIRAKMYRKIVALMLEVDVGIHSYKS